MLEKERSWNAVCLVSQYNVQAELDHDQQFDYNELY